jgi:hypothetical protein
MTKLLEQAIEQLRQLPEEMQDRAARALMLQLLEDPEPGDLEAIEKGREDLKAGRFVRFDDWMRQLGSD